MYVVTRSGRLQVRATDDGATYRWVTGTNIPGAILSGPVAAVSLENEAAVVLALGVAPGVFSPQLSLFGGSLPRDAAYVQITAGAPVSGIRAGSSVAAVAAGQHYCAYVESGDGNVGVFGAATVTGWAEFPVGTETGFSSPSAVVLGTDVDAVHALFVVGDSGEIHSLAWPSCGEGNPVVNDLGQPPGGSVNVNGSLAASVSPDGSRLQLFAASHNRGVYVRFLVEGSWTDDWLLLAKPGDVLRSVGGLAGAAIPNAGAPPHAFFLGRIATPTAHLFDGAFLGPSNDYIGPALRLRDVRGVLADSANPLMLGTLTESHGTYRNGRIVIAATDSGGTIGGNATDRVRFSVSTNGGYTFKSYATPTTFGSQFSIAGDPATAIDSTGRMWVLWHEFDGGPGCIDPYSPPPFARSQILLGYSDGAELTLVSPMPDSWGVTSAGIRRFVDHPFMAITSDGTQHFVWQLSQGRKFQYIRRVNGEFDPTTTDMVTRSIPPVDDVAGNGPYIEADDDDSLYVWWRHDQDSRAQLTVCRLADGVCPPGSEVVVANPPCFPFGVPFGSVYHRGGSANLAVVHDAVGHLAAVFTDIQGAACDQARRWGFVESHDGGANWSVPAYPAEASGNAQFQPSVATTADGTMIVTYYEALGPNAAARRIAVRPAGSGVWHVNGFPNVPGFATFNPTELPHKCGDLPGELFLGDYNFLRGSRTHAYVLGFDRSGPLSSTPSLYLSAVSGASWN